MDVHKAIADAESNVKKAEDRVAAQRAQFDKIIGETQERLQQVKQANTMVQADLANSRRDLDSGHQYLDRLSTAAQNIAKQETEAVTAALGRQKQYFDQAASLNQNTVQLLTSTTKSANGVQETAADGRNTGSSSKPRT